MNKIYKLLIAALVFLCSACATHKLKISDIQSSNTHSNEGRTLEKKIYLIGDAGYAKPAESTKALKAFEKLIDGKNTSDDYLVFLGDNIYNNGLPGRNHPERELAEHRLDVQVDAAKKFKGKTLFIPGNHDWYSNGLPGLKRQEEYLEKELRDSDVFQPENGCPYEKIELTENIIILAIDSQWYITNWDKHPTINDECEIKTRNEFFLEIEGELKKNNEKTIILAMHHPALTYGVHGGYFNVQKHLFPTNSGIPIPGLGSLATIIRTQGGVSPQDRNNSKYDELMDRLITLSRDSDRIIFVSGHEHALQYIENEGIKQIVSGSGSKTTAVSLGQGAKFVYGEQGFAVLNIFDDGSSEVNFYSAENESPKILYSSVVHQAPGEFDTSSLPDSFDSSRVTSAYPKKAIEKTNGYKWFWGDHYRDVYGIDITVPVATLDTLYGGFTIERKGGGHQTRSLRLIDKKGRNFALRAVKKSAVQFLQSVAFKSSYVADDFRETLTEEVIFDFYTSSHPYATFVTPSLSDAAGVFHTNPMLLYMPKHKALGKYNTEYGDELYIIEERPDDGFLDVASFGKPDAIESTDDLRKKLRSDEKYKVDENAFVRARLFDILLGDWDRHQDQWRWARFDLSDDERVYKPIPRDRDQVFSNYDGALLDVLKAILPVSRQFQEYEGSGKDVKWLNVAGIKVDRTFAQTATRDVWLNEARILQERLTDEEIEKAFGNLPVEVQNATAEKIKGILKERRGNLVDMAGRYYGVLAKLAIFTGTDKDDYIEIKRGNGTTTVSFSRIIGGQVQPPYKQRVLSRDETSEIWIYGLDDDDQIVVNGKGSRPIFTRIIGGQNNDVYTIENGRKIRVYDHKSKPNTVVKKGGAGFRFTDQYTNNNYDYKRYIDRVNSIIPLIGFNPDDGLLLGLLDTYTIKGFKTDPFSQKHNFRAGYYFATNGFDLEYEGEFADVVGSWNLLLRGGFASENFTRNFFGFGNQTENQDDDLGLDYNRVKTGGYSAKIGAAKDGVYGSRVEVTGGVESVEVEDTQGRFISEVFENQPMTFDRMNFGNIDFLYSYSGADSRANTTRGMFFVLKTGVRTNLGDVDRTYGYIHPSIQFYNSLTTNRKLVLRTMAQGQFNIGDDFEFYQAAVLGANTGLRGFREQRFNGESALAAGADLRYNIKRFKTGLLPLELGVFGGFDVGRVWLDGENSDIWHNDFGGGLWLNAVDSVQGQLGLFSSDEGLRISFGFGVSL